MAPPGLKEITSLFLPRESGDLLEDQSLTLAGFNARGNFFVGAKIAFAHRPPFPIQCGDTKGTGQQAGAASHAGFRVILHSPSVLFTADAAGDASFDAGGLGTLLAFPYPGSAAGKEGRNPFSRFSRRKAAGVSRTQRI